MTRSEFDQRDLYQLVFEKSPVGIFHYDPAMVITDCNPRFAEILRATHDQLIGLDMHTLKDQSVSTALLEPLAGREGVYEGLYRSTTSDVLLWISMRTAPLRGPTGRITGCVGIVEDITDRKKAEELLLHESIHDSLTGLPNRTLFLDRVTQAVRMTRRGVAFGVVMFDLDRFKVVNDSLGHGVGDRLLSEVAERVAPLLPPGDTLARLGGDEFAILLENLGDPTRAIELAAAVQDVLAQPFYPMGIEVFVSASVGITTSARGYRDPHEALRDADAAMYQAKAGGRARHEVFDPTMHRQALATFEIEVDLRRAIDRRELYLEYQPIVSLLTGAISGFEALVRWRHPRRGLISPVEFIPVAEETGLIEPIGHWILREATSRLKDWRDTCAGAEHLVVTVNVSGRQFAHPRFIELLHRVLDESGVDPEGLALELTESMLFESSDLARDRLARIADLGVRLLLDDFGTGYSSLAYLHRFPLDALKIDQSFVERLLVDQVNLGIVRTILALADHLRMDVIAEGIESEEQRVRLIELDCANGQGYHFSMPLGVDEVPAVLARGRLPWG